MLTNFDCDCFFIADRAALIRTLSVLPEYLKNQATASGAVFDYRDWHIPLGRRFRALKLWFVIHHYGVNGLLEHVRAHVEMAREFAGVGGGITNLRADGADWLRAGVFSPCRRRRGQPENKWTRSIAREKSTSRTRACTGTLLCAWPSERQQQPANTSWMRGKLLTTLRLACAERDALTQPY